MVHSLLVHVFFPLYIVWNNIIRCSIFPCGFLFLSELNEIESDNNNAFTGKFRSSASEPAAPGALAVILNRVSQWHWPDCHYLREKWEMWVWEMPDISAAQPSGVFSVTSVCRWQECWQRKCQRGYRDRNHAAALLLMQGVRCSCCCVPSIYTQGLKISYIAHLTKIIHFNTTNPKTYCRADEI